MLDDSAPEDQHVDARIAAPGDGVLRHGEGALAAAVPTAEPREAAGLQLGDDLAGDFVIEARPVTSRNGRAVHVWTSRVSATGAGASLPALNPSRRTGSALSLSAGRCGQPAPQKGSAETLARPQGKLSLNHLSDRNLPVTTKLRGDDYQSAGKPGRRLRPPSAIP